MGNFDVFKVDDNMFELLVVMKTCEPPLDFLPEIGEYLKEIKYKGFIAIDQMLHSGNTEERFIVAFYDGEDFIKESFKFENINRRSAIRKHGCDILRSKPEINRMGILNQTQRRLITKGCFL